MASGVINTVTDQLTVLTNKTSMLSANGHSFLGTNLELNPHSTTANNGGHIDFHYNASTSDWTSRIIEGASGRLDISASNGVWINSLKVRTLPKTVNFPNWHNMLPMRTDSDYFYFYANGLIITEPSSSNIYKSGTISVTQMTKMSGSNSYTGNVTVSSVYQRQNGLEIVATITNSVTGNGLVVLNGTITVN